MSTRLHLRPLTAVLSACCLAIFLAGCGAQTPTAQELLTQAQEAAAQVSSYSAALSADFTLRKEDAASTAALDIFCSSTLSPRASSQSVLYAVRSDAEQSVSASTTYVVPDPEHDDQVIAYTTFDNESWYRQSLPWEDTQTVPAPQALSGLFGSDASLTVGRERYRETDAYVITGALSGDTLAGWLESFGALEAERDGITAQLELYVAADTALPLAASVTCADPSGFLERGVVTMEFSGYDAVPAITVPEGAAEAAVELGQGTAGSAPSYDSEGRTLLRCGGGAVAIGLPARYQPNQIFSDQQNALFSAADAEACEGVHYTLSADGAEAVAEELDHTVESYAADPSISGLRRAEDVQCFTVAGHTVYVDWISYTSGDEGLFTIEYNLWSELDQGLLLQCYLDISGGAEAPPSPEPEAVAGRMFAQVEVVPPEG